MFEIDNLAHEEACDSTAYSRGQQLSRHGQCRDFARVSCEQFKMQMPTRMGGDGGQRSGRNFLIDRKPEPKRAVASARIAIAEGLEVLIERTARDRGFGRVGRRRREDQSGKRRLESFRKRGRYASRQQAQERPTD